MIEELRQKFEQDKGTDGIWIDIIGVMLLSKE